MEEIFAQGQGEGQGLGQQEQGQGPGLGLGQQGQTQGQGGRRGQGRRQGGREQRGQGQGEGGSDMYPCDYSALTELQMMRDICHTQGQNEQKVCEVFYCLKYQEIHFLEK